jgi:molybdenum cofactor biosynthesis enzyme MoaA
MESCSYKDVDPIPNTYSHTNISAKIKISSATLSLDETCNLWCSKCRERPISINDNQVKLRKDLLNKLLQSKTIRNTKILTLCAGGEPFASKVFADFFSKDANNDIIQLQEVRIITNLQLFTVEKFSAITNFSSKIYLTVSIDGATAETYESLQRGAKFHILRENLKIVAQLRKSGKIAHWTVTMVIQQANVDEIHDEIHWMEALGVDTLILQKIRNFGTWDDKLFFENISLYDRELRYPKQQYRSLIEQALIWNGHITVVLF